MIYLSEGLKAVFETSFCLPELQCQPLQAFNPRRFIACITLHMKLNFCLKRYTRNSSLFLTAKEVSTDPIKYGLD